jgi:phage shock protein C
MPLGGAYGTGEASSLRGSTSEVRASMRDIDRRMAEVEDYVTTSNTSLSREIENLR